ncbi:nuclear transport factor 2 family protein [Streptomyces sp. NPDC051773]|uniref:nuclear transport factor 2 family protein n=1 Tax=Streptomyces sp. NPDC051773 TaxID=3156682 RepID=UPI00342204F3
MNSTRTADHSTQTRDHPTTAGRSRADVADLLARYFVSLDDEELDDTWAAGLFTKDAVVAFPISRHQGVEGMAAYHRAALEAFAATQHLGSPPVVTVDGDRAVLRANLISTHVHHAHHARPQGELAPLFATGTFVDGEARRTPAGWRLSLLSFRLLWADGTPPPPTTAG